MPPVTGQVKKEPNAHSIAADESGLLENKVNSPAPPSSADPDTGQYQDSSPWYVTAVVDSFYNPKKTLLTHISGMRWNCTFYQQIRDSNESLNHHQRDKNGAYQQYRKIERFNIRVDSPFAETQNEQNSNELQGTGEATIYNSLIPNAGDMFIADINDGREGIFKIVRSKRLTLTKSSCYSIEFMLHGIVALRPELKEDLDRKVIQTFVYHENYLLHGLNPFLTDEESTNLVKIQSLLVTMVEDYLGEFYNHQVNTLILPGIKSDNEEGEVHYLYDPYLTEFVIKTMDGAADHVRLMNITGSSSYQDFRRETFWDLILKRMNTRASRMIAKIGWYNIKSIFSQPHLNSIQYTPVEAYTVGIEDVGGKKIEPNERNNQLGVGYRAPSGMAGTWVAPVYDNPDIPTGIVDIDVYVDPDPFVWPPIPDAKPPIIYPCGYYQEYILSPFWYKKERVKYSTVEAALDDYLTNEIVDVSKITQIVNDMDNWSQLARFQYTPLVYSLMKMVVLGY